MRNYIVYEKENYCILMIKGRYIVYNTLKPFKDGHTHLRSYRMAKGIIDYCIEKRIPNVTNNYLLVSAIRVTEDKEYRDRVKAVLERRQNRSNNKYYNINKGVKR